LVIPGRSGFVAPWGGRSLLACTRSAATSRRLLAAVPGAAVAQDGADGQNVSFGAEHLQVVAGLLRLRKRRRLSDGNKQAAAGRLRPFAFTPGTAAQARKPAKSRRGRPTSGPGPHGGV
jgi:hypothetical protein